MEGRSRERMPLGQENTHGWRGNTTDRRRANNIGGTAIAIGGPGGRPSRSAKRAVQRRHLDVRIA
jgi:hypothetical protein